MSVNSPNHEISDRYRLKYDNDPFKYQPVAFCRNRTNTTLKGRACTVRSEFRTSKVPSINHAVDRQCDP